MTRLVLPPLPPLECAPAPLPPQAEASDNDWAVWKARDHAAGQDCRDRLAAVKAAVGK